MFNNLSIREKILLALVFIIAVGAVYYFYFYQPLTEEIANLEREKNQKSTRLDTAIGYARRLPEIKEEYNLLVADLEERGVYLDKDVIDLLIDFREAARDNNLDLTLYRPSMVESGISMSIIIDGGFKEVTELFDDFKEWNYWFEFSSLDIKRNSDDGVTISMNVIYHDQMIDLEGVEQDA
ncbi:MAG: type 4a pilus biogenesis protein PilO [Halanaerobiales bacterium]